MYLVLLKNNDNWLSQQRMNAKEPGSPSCQSYLTVNEAIH